MMNWFKWKKQDIFLQHNLMVKFREFQKWLLSLSLIRCISLEMLGVIHHLLHHWRTGQYQIHTWPVGRSAKFLSVQCIWWDNHFGRNYTKPSAIQCTDRRWTDRALLPESTLLRTKYRKIHTGRCHL